MAAPGFRGTQELAYGKTAQVVRCWPELNGVIAAPGTTTYSAFKPGKGPPEDTALVTGAATLIAAFAGWFAKTFHATSGGH